jgi:tyrosinase
MGVFGSARYGQGSDQEETGGGGHEVPVSGTVPLTAALVAVVKQGGLEGLEEEDVKGFLRRDLKVRVLGQQGEVLGEGACVEGVEVGVVSAVVAAPWSEDELPRWEEGREVFSLC